MNPNQPPKKEELKITSAEGEMGKEPHKENDTPLEYAKKNKQDILAYFLLIVGTLLLFFLPSIGGLIIGLVFGFYFSKEILRYIREMEHFVDNQGIGRSVVLAASLLAFLIALPSFFVGAAITVAIHFYREG